MGSGERGGGGLPVDTRSSWNWVNLGISFFLFFHFKIKMSIVEAKHKKTFGKKKKQLNKKMLKGIYIKRRSLYESKSDIWIWTANQYRLQISIASHLDYY